jgi:hypothetical protein
MKVSQAAKLWLEYHNVNSKKNTSRAYELTMSKFVPQFHDTHLNTLMSDGMGGYPGVKLSVYAGQFFLPLFG